MTVEGKKASLGQKTVDRLSDLPDCIIHLIIAILDTKAACRTSILSKRWRNVWGTTTILDFQPRYFVKEELDAKLRDYDPNEKQPEWVVKESNDKYLSFIETTMQRYSRKNMSIRKLNLELSTVDHDLALMIDRWLVIAVRTQIEELSVTVVSKDSLSYTLPTVVFSAKSLKSLSCSRVGIPFYKPNKLISLECLSLCDVTIEEDMIQQMINLCPLSNLLLRTCIGLKTISIPHFSKIEKIELWMSVERGGTINVESSNVVSLYYYSSGGGVEPSWPCNIHVGLRNLRSLGLYGAAITDDILGKLISGLVVVETITICSCNLLESININGNCLKELSLNDCFGLTSVTLDTPNMDVFCYNGEPNIALLATNLPPKCLVSFCIDPDTKSYTRWFIKLKKFLVESNVCTYMNMYTSGDLSEVVFNEDQARKIFDVPAYKLGEMRLALSPMELELSSLSALVDGLLWSCHPDLLSIPLTLRESNIFAETFINMLKNRADSWWHPLKRIEVAAADCCNLLDGGEVEIRFKLYW